MYPSKAPLDLWMPLDLLIIFEWSIEKYGKSFMEFLGDHNSRVHKHLLQEGVYGNVEIQKHECVGLV